MASTTHRARARPPATPAGGLSSAAVAGHPRLTHASVRLEGKRMIFAAAPAHGGSELLALALGCLPEIAAFHEAEPHFSHCMREAQLDPRVAARFWADAKLRSIASAPWKVYVETTHLFCQGFVEPLLDLGERPDLVVLSPSRREVALALHGRACVPARTETGLRYLLGPDDPDTTDLPGWDGLVDYQLCFWYAIEMGRRAARYERIFRRRGARVAKTSAERILTPSGFAALAEDLGLAPLDDDAVAAHARLLGERADPGPPRPDAGIGDPEPLEREVLERIALATLREGFDFVDFRPDLA